MCIRDRPCAINVVTDEPGRTVMEMTLKEGKNREIRRMCEAVGLEAVSYTHLDVYKRQPSCSA